MELGFQFDDELFENPSERSFKKGETESTLTYQPKWCEKEWIQSAALPDDPADRVHIIKYKADDLYHKGQYSQALVNYSEALSSLGSSLQVGLLKQELIEAKARCLSKLGRFQEALTLAHELVEFQGDEASYWFLVAELNRNLRNTDGELKALQRCVNLHTWSANFWFSLAQAYENAAEVATETPQNQTVKLVINEEILHKQTFSCQCRRLEDDLVNLPVHPNESDNEARHTCSSTCNSKCVGSEEPGSPFLLCDNAICVGRFSDCKQSQHTYSCSSEKKNIVVESGETVGTISVTCNKSSSAKNPTAGCCLKSSVDVNEVTSDLSRVRLLSANVKQVSRISCCRHTRNYNEGCSSSDTNDRNVDSPATLQLSVKNLRQVRFHLFSYCCLIHARFLLKRACETSASFVRENINRVARQVDDKISTHHYCRCQDVLHLITERLTSEKTEKESQDKKDTGNETTNCKVVEAGERVIDFEEHWFGMLHI